MENPVDPVLVRNPAEYPVSNLVNSSSDVKLGRPGAGEKPSRVQRPDVGEKPDHLSSTNFIVRWHRGFGYINTLLIAISTINFHWIFHTR